MNFVVLIYAARGDSEGQTCMVPETVEDRCADSGLPNETECAHRSARLNRHPGLEHISMNQPLRDSEQSRREQNSAETQSPIHLVRNNP